MNDKIKLMGFTYTLPFENLAGGTSLTMTFNVENDSNFRWAKSAYAANIALAAQTDSSRVIPIVNALISNTGSGRNLQSTATPLPILFGTGQIPAILTSPILLVANSTISVTLSNTSATTYNIYLSFIGDKIFRD